MQAFELPAQIDHFGFIKIHEPLKIRDKKLVRIIALVSEEDEIPDGLWLNAIHSPAFDFLEEEAENIYTIEDGQPVFAQ